MKIKLYRHIFYFFSFLILVSCNNVKDLQPAGGEDIPDGVAQVLTNAYPSAKDITLKTVLKDKLWEARFSSDGTLFYVALNTNRVLKAYKLLGETVPDSLQNTFSNLTIKGGTFSDFKLEEQPGGILYYSAKYTFNGIDFSVEWEPQIYKKPGQYQSVGITPYYKFRYTLYSMSEIKTDIPTRITDYLNTVNLLVHGAVGIVSDSNKVSFFIYEQKIGSEYSGSNGLLFDQDANLISGYSPEMGYPLTNDRDYSSLAECPPVVKKFVENSTFVSNMNFTNGYEKKTNAVAVFSLSFIRHFTNLENRELCNILLDKNGELVSISYVAYIDI